MYNALSLFDCSNKIRNGLNGIGFNTLSLDISKGYKKQKVDVNIDILKWKYQDHPRNYFKFMFIALPCQTYSIASAGFHFKKGIPVTANAIKGIEILIRIYQITQYFKCDFIIENPSGGLVNNPFFKAFFNLEVIRITLSSFGFPTQKKTDLFINFPLLFMHSKKARVNGRYQNKKLDNLTYRQRVTYPDQFIDSLTSSLKQYYF